MLGLELQALPWPPGRQPSGSGKSACVHDWQLPLHLPTHTPPSEARPQPLGKKPHLTVWSCLAGASPSILVQQ